jgi:hypothetical protein
MTIYIVSAGRSGSGWLATCLMAAGLRTVHEWTPHNVIDPDVVADTSLIWSWTNFLRTLKEDDVVIALERPLDEIEASITKLLGWHDWSNLFRQWNEFSQALRLHGTATDVHVAYDDLFTQAGRETIQEGLRSRYPYLDKKCLAEVWDFMGAMRVTNKAVEARVLESHGR